MEVEMLFKAQENVLKRISVFWLMLAWIFGGASATDAQTNTTHVVTTNTTRAERDPLPEFEVATIKPVNPDARQIVGASVFPGGRVVLTGFSLKMLVCTAFDVSYWQVKGGESWTDKVSYNVEAEPPESMKTRVLNLRHTLFTIDDQNLRQMLQALLVDRFHLKFRREIETRKLYRLERNGKTLHLQSTKTITSDANAPADKTGSIGFAERWVISNTTMPQLARFASDYVLHSPVLDKTDLTGSFDYKSAAEDWDSYKSDPTGSFLDLIRELGLKLESAKGPVDMFVIEQADLPSPN